MKNLKIHDFSVQREPLIEINKLLEIPKKEDELEKFVRDLFENKIFTEAVFLSSPELYNEWNKMRFGKINKNIIDSIIKYYLRAMSNTVPFGLMATYSLQSDTLKLGNDKPYSRYSGLDLEYIYKILNFCKNIPEVVENQTFYTNNTIYEIGNTYRYIERKINNNNLYYNLASLEKNELLSYLVQLDIKKLSFQEILSILIESTDDYSKSELHSYLMSLIDESFFVSNFDINLNSSVSPIDQLIALIQTNKSLASLCTILKEVRNILYEIDDNVFNEIETYTRLYSLLDQINIDYNKKYVINSNLKKNLGNEPFKIPKAKIKKALEIMFTLTPKTRKNSTLEDFKTRFTNRYGDAEVSLLEALDNDLGIGYKFFSGLERYSSLTDDVNIQPPYDTTENSQTEPIIMSFWAKHFMTKKPGEEINLRDEDISLFKKDIDFEGSFNLSVNHVGENFIVKSAGGTSALNLISRFSNLDNDCDLLTNAITDEEKEYFYDKALYEISHIPYYRGGNLLLRNVNREYNINLLTPYEEGKQYLQLSDLLISIKYGKIVITSKKIDKEIIPFVTSAQNFHNDSTPIYQFLCDLQTSYRPNSSYVNFGGLSILNYIFKPRICYDEIIVSPASWNIKKSYFSNSFSISDLKDFIKKHRIPRFVHLYELGEEKMIFDLENNNILQIIVDEIKKKYIVSLHESFFVKSTNNSYKESIYFLSFKKQVELGEQRSLQMQNLHTSGVRRSFILGSEWLYVKIYCGIGSANKILIDMHEHLISPLLNSKIIDKWFFIRYKDPDFHIRIRLHVSNIKNIGKVISEINEICEGYIADKYIWKLDYSTYDRELERYNWNFIENAETIFYVDSEAAVKSMLQSSNVQLDWYLIFLSILGYFESLQFNLEERSNIITNIYTGFYAEFGEPKNFNKEINKKLDNNYYDLYNFIENKEYQKDFSFFDFRNNIIKNSVKNLDKKEKYYLIDSLIHMTVNRLVESNPRFHELIIYGVLMKYFKKQIGLKKIILQ